MLKKMLYIENVATANASSFYRAALEAAHRCGYEFHLAYNCLDYSKQRIAEIEQELDFVFHQVDFVRNPFNPGNIAAAKQLKKIIEKEKFDCIHCNTPIGGVLGRIVASQCGVTPVIYQAHGFHFYKGSPLINWLLYYPVEKTLAHLSDAIITINKEDHQLALKRLHPRKNGTIYYVPGVGIDLSAYTNSHDSRKELRSAIGLNDDSIMLISAGRLDSNKNNAVIIRSLRTLDKRVHYVLCGEGEERSMLERISLECGVSERVHFLGNRSDMIDIYKASDIFVLPSYREGLSRSIMEAMAAKLPCVVSKIRGNVDLINENGGYLCSPNDIEAFSAALSQLINNSEAREKMGENNAKMIVHFSLESVIDELEKIYQEVARK